MFQIGNNVSAIGKEIHLLVYEEFYQGLVKQTPVLTSQARGGWRSTINRPSSARKTELAGVSKTRDPLTSAERDQMFRLRPLVRKAPLGLKLWITNNVPYAYLLNIQGFSQKTPRGVIIAGFAQADAGIRKRIRQYIFALRTLGSRARRGRPVISLES